MLVCGAPETLFGCFLIALQVQLYRADTNCVSGAACRALGDVCSQKIDGTLDKKWDYKRTLLTSVYGGLFIGKPNRTFRTVNRSMRRLLALAYFKSWSSLL